MERSTGIHQFADSFCDDGSINVLEFIQSDVSSVREAVRKTAKKRTPVKKKKAKGMKQTPMKRKRKPKPADMPRRPLSAYNIFFQEQRALIIGSSPKPTEPTNFTTKIEETSDSPSFVRKKRAHRKTHGKISFADLAKQIGRDWNMLDANGRERFKAGAAKEKARYVEELRIYKLKKGETTGNGPRKEEIESPKEASLSKTNRPPRSPSRKRDHYYESGESQPLEMREGEHPQVTDSLTGLTIEYRHNPRQSRRYHNLRDSNSDVHSSRDCFQPDGFHPLPFDGSFDTSDLVNDRDMVKLVSPLLETRRGPMPPLPGSESSSRHRYYHSHDDVRRERDMSRNVYGSPIPSFERSRYTFGSPAPSIERTGSNTSVLSTEHSGHIPETEVADFLSAFLGNDSNRNKRQSRDRHDHVDNAAYGFDSYKV